jgi:hypothetical protein
MLQHRSGWHVCMPEDPTSGRASMVLKHQRTMAAGATVSMKPPAFFIDTSTPFLARTMVGRTGCAFSAPWSCG